MAGKKYLLAVETEFILGPASHVLVQWEGVFVYVCYYFVIRQSECPGEEQQQETRPGFPVALWGKTDEVSQGFTTHPKSNTNTYTVTVPIPSRTAYVNQNLIMRLIP